MQYDVLYIARGEDDINTRNRQKKINKSSTSILLNTNEEDSSIPTAPEANPTSSIATTSSKDKNQNLQGVQYISSDGDDGASDEKQQGGVSFALESGSACTKARKRAGTKYKNPKKESSTGGNKQFQEGPKKCNRLEFQKKMQMEESNKERYNNFKEFVSFNLDADIDDHSVDELEDIFSNLPSSISHCNMKQMQNENQNETSKRSQTGSQRLIFDAVSDTSSMTIDEIMRANRGSRRLSGSARLQSINNNEDNNLAQSNQNAVVPTKNGCSSESLKFFYSFNSTSILLNVFILIMWTIFRGFGNCRSVGDIPKDYLTSEVIGDKSSTSEVPSYKEDYYEDPLGLDESYKKDFDDYKDPLVLIFPSAIWHSFVDWTIIPAFFVIAHSILLGYLVHHSFLSITLVYGFLFLLTSFLLKYNSINKGNEEKWNLGLHQIFTDTTYSSTDNTNSSGQQFFNAGLHLSTIQIIFLVYYPLAGWFWMKQHTKNSICRNYERKIIYKNTTINSNGTRFVDRYRQFLESEYKFTEDSVSVNKNQIEKNVDDLEMEETQQRQKGQQRQEGQEGQLKRVDDSERKSERQKPSVNLASPTRQEEGEHVAADVFTFNQQSGNLSSKLLNQQSLLSTKYDSCVEESQPEREPTNDTIMFTTQTFTEGYHSMVEGYHTMVDSDRDANVTDQRVISKRITIDTSDKRILIATNEGQETNNSEPRYSPIAARQNSIGRQSPIVSGSPGVGGQSPSNRDSLIARQNSNASVVSRQSIGSRRSVKFRARPEEFPHVPEFEMQKINKVDLKKTPGKSGIRKRISTRGLSPHGGNITSTTFSDRHIQIKNPLEINNPPNRKSSNTPDTRVSFPPIDEYDEYGHYTYYTSYPSDSYVESCRSESYVDVEDDFKLSFRSLDERSLERKVVLETFNSAKERMVKSYVRFGFSSFFVIGVVTTFGQNVIPILLEIINETFATSSTSSNSSRENTCLYSKENASWEGKIKLVSEKSIGGMIQETVIQLLIAFVFYNIIMPMLLKFYLSSFYELYEAGWELFEAEDGLVKTEHKGMTSGNTSTRNLLSNLLFTTSTGARSRARSNRNVDFSIESMANLVKTNGSQTDGPQMIAIDKRVGSDRSVLNSNRSLGTSILFPSSRSMPNSNRSMAMTVSDRSVKNTENGTEIVEKNISTHIPNENISTGIPATAASTESKLVGVKKTLGVASTTGSLMCTSDGFYCTQSEAFALKTEKNTAMNAAITGNTHTQNLGSRRQLESGNSVLGFMKQLSIGSQPNSQRWTFSRQSTLRSESSRRSQLSSFSSQRSFRQSSIGSLVSREIAERGRSEHVKAKHRLARELFEHRSRIMCYLFSDGLSYAVGKMLILKFSYLAIIVILLCDLIYHVMEFTVKQRKVQQAGKVERWEDQIERGPNANNTKEGKRENTGEEKNKQSDTSTKSDVNSGTCGSNLVTAMIDMCTKFTFTMPHIIEIDCSEGIAEDMMYLKHGIDCEITFFDIVMRFYNIDDENAMGNETGMVHVEDDENGMMDNENDAIRNDANGIVHVEGVLSSSELKEHSGISRPRVATLLESKDTDQINITHENSKEGSEVNKRSTKPRQEKQKDDQNTIPRANIPKPIPDTNIPEPSTDKEHFAGNSIVGQGEHQVSVEDNTGSYSTARSSEARSSSSANVSKSTESKSKSDFKPVSDRNTVEKCTNIINLRNRIPSCSPVNTRKGDASSSSSSNEDAEIKQEIEDANSKEGDESCMKAGDASSYLLESAVKSTIDKLNSMSTMHGNQNKLNRNGNENNRNTNRNNMIQGTIDIRNSELFLFESWVRYQVKMYVRISLSMILIFTPLVSGITPTANMAGFPRNSEGIRFLPLAGLLFLTLDLAQCVMVHFMLNSNSSDIKNGNSKNSDITSGNSIKSKNSENRSPSSSHHASAHAGLTGVMNEAISVNRHVRKWYKILYDKHFCERTKILYNGSSDLRGGLTMWRSVSICVISFYGVLIFHSQWDPYSVNNTRETISYYYGNRLIGNLWTEEMAYKVCN